MLFDEVAFELVLVEVDVEVFELCEADDEALESVFELVLELVFELLLELEYVSLSFFAALVETASVSPSDDELDVGVIFLVSSLALFTLPTMTNAPKAITATISPTSTPRVIFSFLLNFFFISKLPLFLTGLHNTTNGAVNQAYNYVQNSILFYVEKDNGKHQSEYDRIITAFFHSYIPNPDT